MMRYYIVTFCLVFGITNVNATDNIDWSQISGLEVEEMHQRLELKKRSADYKILLKAKNYLVNGEIKRAMFYLRKLDKNRSALGIVRDRYKAITYFIEGKYEESLKILSDKKFNKINYYNQTCLLKLINYMILDKEEDLKDEFVICSASLFKWSRNDQLWLESIFNLYTRDEVALKGRDIYDLVPELNNNETIRLWLKLGLYTNRENIIVNYINNLPGESFKSNRIRELIALVYYRLGDVKKAKEFIEDIYGPNAENIKGNINLEEKKYELAFGHFKLALLRKENSANALERALPLAWLLGQWRDGLDLLSRLVNNKTDIKKKLALNTAFQIRLENFERTFDQLNELKTLYQGEFPKELNIMMSYTALRKKDKDNLKKYAAKSCRKMDGLNCWLDLQLNIWEDISKTIDRDEKIVTTEDLTVGLLKIKPEPEPLREGIIVDQRDIEELDSLEVILKEGQF